ncbi:hypothetical protein M413DRAFT_443184 [Hebeloma cylindrosporum]|uniref:Uncharacterized protein n=1 Tax=Hebeloma cylindrosporum TaxID=76867 RepID=A0A0C2YT37_HEBCY|nr:hypothetical protein M413DRAFT_443184 [Hebeloma cylindrosporum h7]
MSESGIWPTRHWGSGEGNEATGGSGLYNKQVETRTIGLHPDNAFIPTSASHSYSSQTTTISSAHSTTNTQTELEMRTISLRTFFGVNASLATNVPGKLTVSTRASSMPLIPQQKGMDGEMDVEMGDSTTSPARSTPKSRRTQSEYIIRIPHDEEMEVEETKPHVTHPPVIRRDCYNNTPKSTLLDITESSNLTEDVMEASTTEDDVSQDAAQRALSPAATEVDDPESQDITAEIQTRGVKVRDFAYAPPYHRPTAPPVAVAPAGSFGASIPPENPQTTYITTTNTPGLPPVTEIFDPYTKITEVDYRWSQETRTYPVPGKSLRRLLDLGWITPAEVAARADPMDLAALEAFDARKPVYPWKSIRLNGKVPSHGERRDMCNARKGHWAQMDRIRDRSEFEQDRKREEEERIGKAFNSGGVKRAHEDDEDDEGDVESKKRRITPEPSTSGSRASVPPPSPPALMPPAKQYPAPLHTYHPSLYPEAASIIESSSQSSSQPRPVFPAGLERADTPPVGEDGEIIDAKGKSRSNLDDEDAAELDDTVGTSTAGRGTKLVHPREGKKMRRVLSRTQTFAQL